MNTPHTLSRRNSTSTFSTAMGLAKMLNERGIKAVTPSCVPTPNNEHDFTPTATPQNSPDGSPVPSRPDSPTSLDALTFGLFSTGAELLKRTFGVEPVDPPSPPQHRRQMPKKRSGPSKQGPSGTKNLADRKERYGMDSGMPSLALPGSICGRRPTPMAQLTFLKSSMPSSSEAKQKLDSAGASLTSSVSDESLAGRRHSSSRRRRSGTRATRPDLGQVKPPVSAANAETSSLGHSALGTLSSLLFGRKGGLL